MAYLKKDDIKTLYKESKTEARLWREQYPEYERLADNGLMQGMDKSLPEVNDGSLSAALFKLPKRIVSSELEGTVKVVDRDEAWISELGNLVWQKYIIPYANTQAPFTRKWKDAVRKAAIYGSVPLITLFVESEGKRHADFIVAQPQDVTLEPGKVSDYDSDIMFWDIYYSKLQLENIIEQAKSEKPAKGKPTVNKWNIPALERILASNGTESREGIDEPKANQDKKRPSGYKFCIAVQKGEDAPFYMYYASTNETVREWSNPDPTGDCGIHFLYCYQDMINPYGIGIVKLAGGTQNVLDYFRQADILATQTGIRPPVAIEGNEDDVDVDSIVYEQDAIWFTGGAKVVRQELSNGIYQSIPERMSMYKTSLNQLIPTGDTSISSGSGDPQYSKTPAGVKFQAASLSIDDEDFKDNLYITYAAVAKSMINVHFANMEGTDLMKLTDDEREILAKGGMEFPENPDGEVSNQLEIKWDDVRAKFDFEVNPEVDQAKDDADKLEGLTKVAELSAADPTFAQDLQAVGKKFNKGELYADMIRLTTDNDKIVTDISPEDEQSDQVDENGNPIEPPQEQTMDMGAEGPENQEAHKMDMAMKQQKMQQSDELHQAKMAKMTQPAEMTAPEGAQGMGQGQAAPVSEEEMQANVEALMKEYGVDENTALAALAAEHQGLPINDIIDKLKEYSQGNES
jgi:hypothetical protein